MKSASSFENIPGKGVHCQVDNKGILVGNQKLMSNSGVAILKATEDYLQENKQWAQTVVVVAFDGAVAGVISHSYPLKQEAAVVVEGLKSMGIKCILVTGNNWQTARSVADEVGIMDVMAEVLPARKTKAI